MAWRRKVENGITNTVTSSGYHKFQADYSLFTKKSHKGFTVILVNVNDLVLGGTNLEKITEINSLLDNKFDFKNLGVL